MFWLHPAGPERDTAIDDWCRSVWTAFSSNRQTINAFCWAPGHSASPDVIEGEIVVLHHPRLFPTF